MDKPQGQTKPTSGLDYVTTPKLESLSAGELAEISIDADEERRVLRKIDWVILPLMAGTFMLQYMDKMTLSNATMMGILEDANLQGSNYSWCSSIFYFGYLIWSWPTTYLAMRFPLGRYLSVTVILWGATLMCHAACYNFTGLMIARFFLGLTEAAISPGFTLIVGMFYRRHEQPARQNAWISGNGLGNIINGVVAYGISRITTARLASWRIQYLIFGAVTVLFAIPLLILLPSSPASAIFLSPREREIAVNRTIENKTGIMDERSYKIGQVWDALRDPQVWLMFLYMLSINIANGAVTPFSSLIINGFGYSTFTTLLLSMPAGGFQLILLALTSFITLRFHKTRMALMVTLCLTSLTGSVLIEALPTDDNVGRLIGLYLTIALSVNTPLLLSLVSSNIAGFTKRSTVSGVMFVAYAAGNIIGPQFFLAHEAPEYPTGLQAVMSSLSLGTFFNILLLVYYLVENARRDRATAGVRAEAQVDQLSNLTDREMPSFRYVI
ncbi:major facilitator superfamily domain-containing protein [Aspergillus insuetus]